MKVCPKCKGKGFGGWVVDNGRCFTCLGSGQVLSTKQEKTDAMISQIKSRMAEIVEVANNLKTAKDNCRSKIVAIRIDADIESRRREWLTLNEELKALIG